MSGMPRGFLESEAEREHQAGDLGDGGEGGWGWHTQTWDGPDGLGRMW